MSKAMSRDPNYRRRRFQPEIIELCVRWHLTYRLSYGDLVEMMAERGIVISHSTILWVQSYVPEFERRRSRYARGVHSSWRMDEIGWDAKLADLEKRLRCSKCGMKSCHIRAIEMQKSRGSPPARRCLGQLMRLNAGHRADEEKTTNC
jgi:hypothetical protein